MKKLYLLLIAIFFNIMFVVAKDRTVIKQSIFSSMDSTSKIAVVMVHFGTTHSDTRALTIDVINKNVKALCDSIGREIMGKPIEVRQAFTSRIVMKRLKNTTGEIVLDPVELLTFMANEKFTHIVIQPTNIIDGIEMEALRADVFKVHGLFKEIRIADPLLYTVNDVNNVADIIGKKYAKFNGCVLLVGHGTYTPITASYSMLEYILHSKGYDNFFVGTIEGHPSLEDAKSQIVNYGKICDSTVKNILLVPFMYVAGEHAKNDISDSWKSYFCDAGYNVDVINSGLGEYDEIRKIFINHLIFAFENKILPISEKKLKFK